MSDKAGEHRLHVPVHRNGERNEMNRVKERFDGLGDSSPFFVQTSLSFSVYKSVKMADDQAQERSGLPSGPKCHEPP